MQNKPEIELDLNVPVYKNPKTAQKIPNKIVNIHIGWEDFFQIM